ncbi:MAG: hypothetical protein ACK48E_00160 [Holosporales bacterium]|jgi:hypothetical protein
MNKWKLDFVKGAGLGLSSLVLMNIVSQQIASPIISSKIPEGHSEQLQGRLYEKCITMDKKPFTEKNLSKEEKIKFVDYLMDYIEKKQNPVTLQEEFSVRSYGNTNEEEYGNMFPLIDDINSGQNKVQGFSNEMRLTLGEFRVKINHDGQFHIRDIYDFGKFFEVPGRKEKERVSSLPIIELLKAYKEFKTGERYTAARRIGAVYCPPGQGIEIDIRIPIQNNQQHERMLTLINSGQIHLENNTQTLQQIATYKQLKSFQSR